MPGNVALMSVEAVSDVRQRIEALSASPEMAAALLAEQCRQSPQFTEDLRKNPHECLLQAGVAINNVQIRTHDNTDDTWHLPLPPPGAKITELSEEQLTSVSAGESAAAIVTLWWVGGLLMAGLGATLLLGGTVAGLSFVIDRAKD